MEKRVAKSIEEYEKTRDNLDNDGSLGGNSENAGGTVNVQGCSHKTFMNGKPHPFNGTESVVVLRRWIEKVEQVFEICKCAKEDKVMFAASTFEGRALTWWNGNEMTSYKNRFHKLVLMCPELVSTKKKKIEKYIQGLPKGVKGNVTSSKPFTLHDAINIARELIEQWIQARALRITPAEGRGYAGNLPWCNRCKAHHQPGSCPPRCSNCHKFSHEEEDCRTRIPIARGNSLQNVTCFGYGEKGYYGGKCPRGRNTQNEGTRGGAYVMRTKEPQQDLNIITGTS
nr:hypothetical protein [Tanacetum cinerariifolium]